MRGWLNFQLDIQEEERRPLISSCGRATTKIGNKIAIKTNMATLDCFHQAHLPINIENKLSILTES